MAVPVRVTDTFPATHSSFEAFETCEARLQFYGMFSKIPQRFSAPFGLLGDEAKLAFPSQPGGIINLFTVRVCRTSWLHHNSNHAVEYPCVRLILGSSEIHFR